MLAQLLWNPQQDNRALIHEFLGGYYGKAGKPIGQYLDLIYEKSRGFYLPCAIGKPTPYLRFQPLVTAERLWQQAETNVANEPVLLERVRRDHLPVRFMWLANWNQLRRECWEQNAEWPLSDSRKVVADEWRAMTKGVPGEEWTHVQTVNEGGETVDQFLAEYGADLPDTNGSPPPRLLANPPPPSDLQGIRASKCIDLQDNLASLYKPGEFSEIRPDTAASDNRAVWLAGDHKEWAFRIHGADLPSRALKGKWKVYSVVRVEKSADAAPDSIAFGAGVYDVETQAHPADAKVKLKDTSEGYHSYLLGTVEFTRDRDIYVAPPGGKNVSAIYIDRVYLVPTL